jgi:hypothetical protein
MNKSEFFQCFIKFKLLVENLFSNTIKYFQTDNGGEYTSTKFKQFLSNHGIFHHLTCPHTSQQNGIAKRKHRHIVKTGLMLLAQSELPPKYWVDSFLTSIFLINRLPSPVTHNTSPFFKLFKKEPDYTLLRTFGCLCYPLLCPYAAHKLSFRSKPCIFLGYGANQRGYHALILNHKKYIFPAMLFLISPNFQPKHHPSRCSHSVPTSNLNSSQLHHTTHTCPLPWYPCPIFPDSNLSHLLHTYSTHSPTLSHSRHNLSLSHSASIPTSQLHSFSCPRSTTKHSPCP